MSQYDNVSVTKKANVYFDGRCISHTIMLPDGSRKTLGVLLPSHLTFNTASAETMDIISGRCEILLDGQTEWQSFAAGESFEVPGNSSFQIRVDEITDYVCHFA
ncbi:MAG: hypothetical protein RIQ52_1578 [Pseudomonadota bacterium]